MKEDNNKCIKNKILNNLMNNFIKFKNFINSIYTNYLINNYKIFLYYLLAFLGFFILCWVIYIRFIRERLPRNIPFMLTEYWFYILIFICISYIYAIKVTIKPPVPNLFLFKIIGYIGLPVLVFDRFIKMNKYVFYRQLELIKDFLPQSGKVHRILLIIFSLVPRIILLIIFLIDVLWFHYLNIFYYFLFLGIFPMIWNYYKFSLYHAKEMAIVHLESLYTWVDIYEEGWDEPSIRYEYNEEYGDFIEVTIEPVWQPHPRNKYHEKMVTIREYVQILLDKEIDEVENDYDIMAGDYYEFDSSPLSKDFRYEQYEKMSNKTELDREDYDILHEEFHKIIPYISKISYHIHYLLPIWENKPYLKIINIIIYTLFLLGWGYILLRSFHTLNDFSITLFVLELLNLHTSEINPFINP